MVKGYFRATCSSLYFYFTFIRARHIYHATCSADFNFRASWCAVLIWHARPFLIFVFRDVQFLFDVHGLFLIFVLRDGKFLFDVHGFFAKPGQQIIRDDGGLEEAKKLGTGFNIYIQLGKKKKKKKKKKKRWNQSLCNF